MIHGENMADLRSEISKQNLAIIFFKKDKKNLTSENFWLFADLKKKCGLYDDVLHFFNISKQMSGVKNETYLVLQICKIGSDVVKQVPKFGSKAIIYTF